MFARDGALVRFLRVAGRALGWGALVGAVGLAILCLYWDVSIPLAASRHLSVKTDVSAPAVIEPGEFVTMTIIGGDVRAGESPTLALFVRSDGPAQAALEKFEPLSTTPATLFVDGEPVAKGGVAAHYNPMDPLAPVSGQTGFFYSGKDCRLLYWRLVLTTWLRSV